MSGIVDGGVETTLAAVFVLVAGVLWEGEAREGACETVEGVVVVYKRGWRLSMSSCREERLLDIGGDEKGKKAEPVIS